jgi:Cd2+/Zn2+-exporting ATPase
MMNIRPDYANLMTGGDIVKVAPQDVQIGDIIIVKSGEQVPLDGVIVKGESSIDTSALTGESIPRELSIGSEILSGSININGLLEIKVKKTFGQSTVSKILDLLENSSKAKSKTETFIRKFAKIYTPTVIAIAFLLAVLGPLFFQEPFEDWLYRALIFLVISCPCALVVSIPLSFFGAIGRASRSGILVKGGNFLEALSLAKTFVFDKTGTLTKGVFEVSEINAENGFMQDEVLRAAAIGEHFSNHPIALSIQKAYGMPIDPNTISNYKEFAGLGISANFDSKSILVGNKKFLARNNIAVESGGEESSANVFVAIDGVFAGIIKISDELKSDSLMTIERLNKIGETIMLSGDNEKICTDIAAKLNISKTYGNLLPNEKVEKFLEIKKLSAGKVIFTGDGINDAPVLASADISIAMGALGSDAAIETADIVLMTDEPSKILTALDIAKKTKEIVVQNIIFIMGVKGAFLVLGALGIAAMWSAIFADVGVAVIAILNSLRALKK